MYPSPPPPPSHIAIANQLPHLVGGATNAFHQHPTPPAVSYPPQTQQQSTSNTNTHNGSYQGMPTPPPVPMNHIHTPTNYTSSNQAIMQNRLQHHATPNPTQPTVIPHVQQPPQPPQLYDTPSSTMYSHTVNSPPQPSTINTSTPLLSCLPRWFTRFSSPSSLGYCPFTRAFQITLLIYLILCTFMLINMFDVLGTMFKMAATSLAFIGIRKRNNSFMGVFTGVLAYDLVSWIILCATYGVMTMWLGSPPYRYFISHVSSLPAICIISAVFIVQQALLVMSVIHLKKGPNPHESEREQSSDESVFAQQQQQL